MPTKPCPSVLHARTPSEKGNHIKNVAGAKRGKGNCPLYLILNFLASREDFPGPIFHTWELWTRLGQSLHHPAWAPVLVAVLSMCLPCCSSPSETQKNGILLFLATLRSAKPICETTTEVFAQQLPCLAFEAFAPKAPCLQGAAR